MTYTPPIAEQRFVLDHVVRIAELAAHERFEAATPDLVDAILEGAGAFAAGEYAPLNRIGDQVGAKWSGGVVTMPPGFGEAYARFVEGGWGTLAAPAEHGGQGLPRALAAAVSEDLGTANMAFNLVHLLSQGAIESLEVYGTPEQKAEWLPKLASGEVPGTMNLTEPQAGSDVGALRATATPLANGRFAIKGTKIYITFGEHDLTENILHLVLARTPDAPGGTRGISLFLVPKVRLDGSLNDVRCVSIEHKLGINASPTCTMSFGDHDACEGELIGPEFGGMAAMFVMMNSARLGVGLQGVEVAERAMQGALGYALERVQSSREGRPARIADHPDVRRMLLRMKALTQGARALVYYAFGQMDRGTLEDPKAARRAELLTPLAKAWGTDVGVEVASLGIQVHGGMGFVEETGAAQHYRDARIAPIYEGTNGIQAADLVGRKLGLEGGEPFHALIAEMRGEAHHQALVALIDACERVGTDLTSAGQDDRLAGSYPFLTMLAVAVAGWLMERQGNAAAGDGDFARAKRTTVAFFLDRIVPEAAGLEAAASAGAAALYDLPADALAA